MTEEQQHPGYCFPSLDEPCGSCHRCTPVEGRTPSPCDDPRGHAWEPAEPACEDCGVHEGAYCPRCGELLDFVWDQRPDGIAPASSSSPP